MILLGLYIYIIEYYIITYIPVSYTHLACGTERSEIGIQVSEVFNAIEEAENTASEYIDNVISLKDDLEQTIDKLREVNY